MIKTLNLNNNKKYFLFIVLQLFIFNIFALPENAINNTKECYSCQDIMQKSSSKDTLTQTVYMTIFNKSNQNLFNLEIMGQDKNWITLGIIYPGENTFALNKTLYSLNGVSGFKFQTLEEFSGKSYMYGNYNYNNNDKEAKITIGSDNSYDVNIPMLSENDNKKVYFIQRHMKTIELSDGYPYSSLLSCRAVSVIYGHIWCSGNLVDFDSGVWGALAIPASMGSIDSMITWNELINMGTSVKTLGYVVATVFHMDFWDAAGIVKIASWTALAPGAGVFKASGGYFSVGTN